MTAAIFLAKAEECLAGAESDFSAGRNNNCANRCYYACFNAARAALLMERIGPRRRDARWDHGCVQAEFAGRLVNRRTVYPPDFRDVLTRLSLAREEADYGTEQITGVQGARGLRRARALVASIRGKVTDNT